MRVGPIIDTALELLYWAIFVRALFSWLRISEGRGPLYGIRKVLEDLTDPILAPIRRVIPLGTNLDFSPIVAMVVVDLVRRLAQAFIRF